MLRNCEINNIQFCSSLGKLKVKLLSGGDGVISCLGTPNKKKKKRFFGSLGWVTNLIMMVINYDKWYYIIPLKFGKAKWNFLVAMLGWHFPGIAIHKSIFRVFMLGYKSFYGG